MSPRESITDCSIEFMVPLVPGDNSRVSRMRVVEQSEQHEPHRCWRDLPQSGGTRRAAPVLAHPIKRGRRRPNEVNRPACGSHAAQSPKGGEAFRNRTVARRIWTGSVTNLTQSSSARRLPETVARTRPCAGLRARPLPKTLGLLAIP
jgi:hypothetical protein